MDEYISREKALSEIMGEYPDAHYPDWYASMIKEIPVADVAEVKYGTWKLHNDGSGTCNQCGITQRSVWDYDNFQHYCGHCGAKMNIGGTK